MELLITAINLLTALINLAIALILLRSAAKK